MKLNIGMNLDEKQARKVLNPYLNNDKTQNPSSFLSQKPHHSLTPQDLKYCTPEDLKEKNFNLSPEEEEIKRLMAFD